MLLRLEALIDSDLNSAAKSEVYAAKEALGNATGERSESHWALFWPQLDLILQFLFIYFFLFLLFEEIFLFSAFRGKTRCHDTRTSGGAARSTCSAAAPGSPRSHEKGIKINNLFGFVYLKFGSEKEAKTPAIWSHSSSSRGPRCSWGPPRCGGAAVAAPRVLRLRWALFKFLLFFNLIYFI